MKRRAFILGAMFGGFARLAAGQGRKNNRNPVLVRARSASTSEPLNGARVFVIGSEGCQLAEAWTGDDGIAALPDIDAKRAPRYVLVDLPFYFVTGRTWTPDLLEYDMKMVALTPPGFHG